MLSLTTIELHQNGLQSHSQVTPLWSMRAVSQASLQRGVYTDPDAWCKWALSDIYRDWTLSWPSPAQWLWMNSDLPSHVGTDGSHFKDPTHVLSSSPLRMYVVSHEKETWVFIQHSTSVQFSDEYVMVPLVKVGRRHTARKKCF